MKGHRGLLVVIFYLLNSFYFYFYFNSASLFLLLLLLLVVKSFYFYFYLYLRNLFTSNFTYEIFLLLLSVAFIPKSSDIGTIDSAFLSPFFELSSFFRCKNQLLFFSMESVQMCCQVADQYILPRERVPHSVEVCFVVINTIHLNLFSLSPYVK